MKRLLVVVDMQEDFVNGALGSLEAKSIVDRVRRKISEEKEKGANIVFTLDTHREDYLETQEGRKLPVPHCIKGTAGWELVPQIQPFAKECEIFEKPTFGSIALAHYASKHQFEKITLVGLCTDICVISNAMLLKAALPECAVCVDASCCAGVTPKSHENALEAMKMCQIEVCGSEYWNRLD